MFTKASRGTGALLTPHSRSYLNAGSSTSWIAATASSSADAGLPPSRWDDPGTLEYVVCNPATERWVSVPEYSLFVNDARLGFDPAISSHFHVFELVTAVALDLNNKYDYRIEEVGIYSSKAGGWTHQIV